MPAGSPDAVEEDVHPLVRIGWADEQRRSALGQAQRLPLRRAGAEPPEVDAG